MEERLNNTAMVLRRVANILSGAEKNIQMYLRREPLTLKDLSDGLAMAASFLGEAGAVLNIAAGELSGNEEEPL